MHICEVIFIPAVSSSLLLLGSTHRIDLTIAKFSPKQGLTGVSSNPCCRHLKGLSQSESGCSRFTMSVSVAWLSVHHVGLWPICLLALSRKKELTLFVWSNRSKLFSRRPPFPPHFVEDKEHQRCWRSKDRIVQVVAISSVSIGLLGYPILIENDAKARLNRGSARVLRCAAAAAHILEFQRNGFCNYCCVRCRNTDTQTYTPSYKRTHASYPEGRSVVALCKAITHNGGPSSFFLSRLTPNLLIIFGSSSLLL